MGIRGVSQEQLTNCVKTAIEYSKKILESQEELNDIRFEEFSVDDDGCVVSISCITDRKEEQTKELRKILSPQLVDMLYGTREKITINFDNKFNIVYMSKTEM